MPILQNPRYEAFAQARASGARLDDAFEDAGFVYGRGHSTRLAHRPEVADRIAELRAAHEQAARAATPHMIAGLLRLAADAAPTPAGAREARMAMMDAWRLSEAWMRSRAVERVDAEYALQNLERSTR